MKRTMVMILAAALLCSCATDKAYWQARSDAIDRLPKSRQAAAYNQLLREWYAKKEYDRQEAARAWQGVALGAAAALAAGSAAHEAQQRETVIIPAPGPGLQVPSWQPTNGTGLWQHEEYQAPKTYYTKPTWGGWVTTEQP